MPRIDVPEIGDSPSCPVFVRDATTDYLQFIEDLTKVFDGAGPVLRRLLDGAQVRNAAATAAAAAAVVTGAPAGDTAGGGGGSGGEGRDGGDAVPGEPPAVGPTAAATARGGARVVLDLCSGAGGALVGLAARGATGRVDVVVLTDLFPNVAAFAAAEAQLPGIAHSVLQPVDASAVPTGLVAAAVPGIGIGSGSGTGSGGGSGCGRPAGPAAAHVRTLFNSLHHLPPPLVMCVLADAARQGQAFAAFEVVERHPVTMLAVLLQGLIVPFVLPLATVIASRRVGTATATAAVAAATAGGGGRLRRALQLAAALLAVPAVVSWDGFASCLRSYSTQELQVFAEAASTDAYGFKVGAAPRRLLGLVPFRLRWIEGEPLHAAFGGGRGGAAVAGPAQPEPGQVSASVAIGAAQAKAE